MNRVPLMQTHRRIPGRSSGRPQRLARARRGSAIVLVTAVLVLLVIIAIAFLSQSSGGRVTAVATQSSSILDDRSSVIAEDVARQVAEALFTRPIDPSDPDVVAGNEANANYPRGPLDLAAVRYGSSGRFGVDPQDFNDPFDFDADGITNEPDGYPDFSYNYAPYETVPWTNWPSLLFRTDDAPGGPGFADSRWLRDTEPNRLVEQGIGYQFSHWQHLTYLPTAENGWRVVADLSDVTGSVVTDLRVPLEQWPPEIASQLATNPNLLLPVPGAVQNTFVNQFLARRDGWFFDYASVYANASSVLPNLWDLKLLGPPSDEFKPGTKRNVVSRTFADTDGDSLTDALWMLAPSSIDQKLRQVVAVSIVDNGGLVNVNAATRFVRRNANEAVVAGALVPLTATTGASPADVALVTAEDDVTRTGLLDNPLNQQGVLFGPGALVDFSYDTDPNFKVRFDPQRWSDAGDGYTFLDEAGVLGNGFVNTYSVAAEAYLTTNPILAPAVDRLRYWKAGAMRPYGDPGLAVTPFGTPEEIELRLFNGQNMPAVLSRLERSLNLSQANDYQLLRSNMQKREESNEFLDQLNAQELLFDTRRKLTTLNGTMNDVMPAALWPSAYPPTIGATDAGYLAAYDLVEYNKVTKRFSVPAIPNNAGQQDAIVLGSDAITTEDQVRWGQLIRKYDLRAYAPDPRLMRDLDGNGLIQEQGGALGSNGVNDFDAQASEQRTMARDHLRRILDRSLVSEGPNATLSYFGKGSDAAKRTRSLVASLGANIEAFGDGLSLLFGSNPTLAPLPIDRPLSFDDARAFEDPSNPGRRFVGVERQPFIMEAVIAHVYSKGEVPASYPGPLHPDDVTAGTRIRIPLGQPDEGEFFVNSESDVHTVVVVQIANPFDRPLVLATRPLAGGPDVPEYRLRVFGKTVTLRFSNCDNAALGAIETLKIDTNGDGTLDYEQLLLLPCTEDEPRTAIVYAIPSEVRDFGVTSGVGSGTGTGMDTAFGVRWRDFFDIGLAAETGGPLVKQELFEDLRTPFADTLRFNATASWTVNDIDQYSASENSSVELLRTTGSNAEWVVVDRLDFEEGGCGTQWEFRDAVAKLHDDPKFRPPDAASADDNYFWDPNNPGFNFFNGIRIKDNDYFTVWARAGRQWRNDDISPEASQGGAINNNQRAPRYVFAKRPDSEIVSNTAGIKKMVGQTEDNVVGDVFRKNQDPDLDPFFVSEQSRRKPTYFTTRTITDPGVAPDAPPFGYVYPRGFPIRMSADTFAAAHSVKSPAWRIRDADKTSGTTSVYPFPMQMIVKDAPFDQVGELLLVPMWGPVVEIDGGSIKTVWTLAEILSGCAPEYPVDNGGNATTDDGIYLNRLRLDARTGDGQAEMTGIDPATGTIADPRALYRWRLPAGVSLFDAFVCDGPGAWPPRRDAYSNTDGFVVQLDPFGVTAPAIDLEEASPRNGGGGFAPGLQVSSTLATETTPADPTAVRGAEAVRGMININTAPIEVMRALPQFCWMIHPDVVLPDDVLEAGRVRVPEAVVQYRDRLQDTTNYLPSYGDRGIVNGFLPGLRVGRGLASAGELLLLRRSSTQKPLALLGTPDPNVATEASYQIDYAAGDVWGFPRYVWPQRSTTPAADARLSTEVNGPTIIPTLNPRNPVLVGPNGTSFGVGDNVAGDVEEANLLFSGVSNLVTTRSDVFTVYFRVRTFGQNPVTGLWDATDPDQIVEDSRYVMQVDRSAVRSPFDRPRIVFIQKVDG